MKKQLQPNREFQKQALIAALQYVYTEYKNKVIKSLKYSFIDSTGALCIPSNQEDMNKEVKDAWKEVNRLMLKLEELNNEIADDNKAR